MSSFDSMTPLEPPPVQCSPAADVQVSSARVDSIYRQSLFLNAAKFSVKGKAAFPSSPTLSPWLVSLVYPLGRYAVLPTYFEAIEVVGRENLPTSGPIILAPTHRSRWDAIMVAYATGYDVTGRHLHFMVSADEVVGFQGWFIRHLGGFPVDTQRPTIASLRYGVELLRNGETLVIFPEGDIFRRNEVQRLKPGLARLALQAEANNQLPSKIQIVPIHISYSQPMVPWKSQVKIQIGHALQVADYHLGAPKMDAQYLTAGLLGAFRELDRFVNY